MRSCAWGRGQTGSSKPGGRRERWRVGSGALTVRDTATGIDNLDVLLGRAGGVLLNETGGPGTVSVATVEDLLAIAEHSPWSEDTLYKAGLRAVLASSHYRAARPARSLVS